MVNIYSYDMYTVIRGFKTFESFKTVECDPGWIMKFKAFDWRTHNFFQSISCSLSSCPYFKIMVQTSGVHCFW